MYYYIINDIIIKLNMILNNIYIIVIKNKYIKNQ